MDSKRRLELLVLITACLAISAPAAKGQSAYFSFNPDPPPIGDGVDYPYSLNPARELFPGAVAPGQFVTDLGVIFSNTNGNPAFFDANNLLTRPANLITNEAFWTDPKIGNFIVDMFPFALSDLGFRFDGVGFGQDFGFDIAIASVNVAPPTSLSVFIQDTGSTTGFVTLDLLGSGAVGTIQPTQVGTFQTLGSPHPGIEARFRISHAALQAELGSPDPVRVFAIDMIPISTVNGTTQLAVDNFVLGGAIVPPQTENEPVLFQSQLIPPSQGISFIFDPFSVLTGIPVDAQLLLAQTVIELSPRSSTVPGSSLDELAGTVTLPGGSAIRDQLSVTVTSPNQQFQVGLPSFITPIGSNIDVTFESAASPGSLFFVEVESLLGDVVVVNAAFVDAQLAVADLTDVFTATAGDLQSVVTQLETRPLGETAAALLSSGVGSRAPGDDFDVYVGHTLQDYLALRSSMSLAPAVGDTGSSWSVVTDGDGAIVDFRITSWMIADQPGAFAPVLLPETSTTATLSLGLLALCGGVRRRAAYKGRRGPSRSRRSGQGGTNSPRWGLVVTNVLGGSSEKPA